MSKDISIKNGANLALTGVASKEIKIAKDSSTVAIYPDDFFSLIPRMIVREGDRLKLGDPIFYDKISTIFLHHHKLYLIVYHMVLILF